MKNSLSLKYDGSKNSYLEEKLADLAQSYGGKQVGDFYFEDGGFNASFAFASEAQENSFKKEAINFGKVLKIEITTGGDYFLP